MTDTTQGTGPGSDAPDNTEAVATRVFDAPRDVVFEVLTNPEYIKRWYGRRMPLDSSEVDLRPGGKFRHVVAGGDSGFVLTGEFSEVNAPSRIVNTWGPEAMPMPAATETTTLEEKDGKTVVHFSRKFAVANAYSSWAGSGAMAGWSETLDQLEKVVAEAAAKGS